MRGGLLGLFLIAISSLVTGCGSTTSSGGLSSATSIPANPVENLKPRPSNAANISVCPSGNVTDGTDVSDADVSTQWTTLKSGGTTFAFIKATEGITFKSPEFDADWSASQKSNVVRGAYHYFHPGDDPTIQAQFFESTVGNLNANDLSPMLDWEVTDGASSAAQIQNAKIWLQHVEAQTHKVPIVYVDPSFWNQLGNPQGFEKYPLFIAHYNVKCPSVPPPWSQWSFWQTGAAKINGIQAATADVDLFNGVLASLHALF